MSAAKHGAAESCEAAAREVDITRKVAFLASPQVYAERPTRVEKVETHFSWVFLTDRHVYKIKSLCAVTALISRLSKPGSAMPRQKCGSIAGSPPTSISGSCR
jgi:hypothetical protein